MRLEHLLSGEVALKSVTSVAGTRKVKKPTVNLRFVSKTLQLLVLHNSLSMGD